MATSAVGDKMIRGHAWLTKVIPGTYLKVKRIEIKELKVTKVLDIAKEMLKGSNIIGFKSFKMIRRQTRRLVLKSHRR